VRRRSRISAGLAVLAALAPSCSGEDAVHGAHTCAIVGGGVLCWGFNYHGQVGDGSPYDRRTPVAAVGLGSGVRALAAGDRFTCAIRGDASVACWGRNRFGQLGDGTTERRRTPTPTLPLPAPVRAVAAGGLHACAVLEGGEVFCWGGNERAQLGDGSRADRASPGAAAAPPGAVDVAAGDRHTCVLLQGGGVACWGGNRYHEVSAVDSEDEPAPRDVPLAEPARAIAAGGLASCAVLASGAVACWGSGMGASPSAIPALSDVVAVDVGSAGACALDARGAVSCWSVPGDVRPVPGVAGAVALSVGFWHSCAVLSDGSIRCWGQNYAGELGDGTGAASDLPVRVAGIDSLATAVVAGEGWDGHHLGCSGRDERE
jgi:alpha-tubulin suppressor-like RCC1 family protein